jgi:hypothetical protein
VLTQGDILQRITWRDSREARCEFFSPVLERTIKVHVLTRADERISDRSIQIINDFLGLSHTHLDTIKQYLWDNCKLNCESSSYGFDVPDGADEGQINHQEFGVFNQDDALEKSTLKYLLISEDDQEDYPNNYGRLQFDNEWNSHLTTIVMKNAGIVGAGDSGLYLGSWEP